MSIFTRPRFKGGVDAPDYKEQSADKPIEKAKVPAQLVVHLTQHIGTPNESLVTKGAFVKIGQKIGDTSAFISAPVHAPASGKVTAVEPRQSYLGHEIDSIVIDVSDTGDPTADDAEQIGELSPEDIRAEVREAGIVGLGGAAFPTSVKLTPLDNKPIDTIIINGCECEPFLTCDHRLMLERSRETLEGSKVLARAAGAEKIIVAVESNKPDAAAVMEKAAADDDSISIAVLPTHYPQGSEKHLIKALLRREVPSGKLPAEVGALAYNVGTAVAIYEALAWGKALYERVVTVTGPGIREPKNLMVRVGTPISSLIEQAGGLTDDTVKVVAGGPMTGFALHDLDVPVTKGISGIIALDRRLVSVDDFRMCVSCGRCVSACPMQLMPNLLSLYAERNTTAQAEQDGALDCIECGACAYLCPSSRPIVQHIRSLKSGINAAKQAMV